MHTVVFLLLWEAHTPATVCAAQLLDNVPYVPTELIEERDKFLANPENPDRFRRMLRAWLSTDQQKELERQMILDQNHFILYNQVMIRRLNITNDQLQLITEDAARMARLRPGYTDPDNLNYDKVIEHAVIWYLDEDQRRRYLEMKKPNHHIRAKDDPADSQGSTQGSPVSRGTTHLRVTPRHSSALPGGATRVNSCAGGLAFP